MTDSVWIISSKTNRRYSSLGEILGEINVDVEFFLKDNLYDRLSETLQLSSIPILILLDPELPDGLVQKLTQWRLGHKWYGSNQSPLFAFIADSKTIENSQKRWDPNDSNNYDFLDIDQLYEKTIARKTIESARKIRKTAQFGLLVGHSEPMQYVDNFIERLKNSATTILILGETGTGKELVARAVHMRGNRSGAPFVPFNVAAVPKDLIESQLYGFEKGAFTGADKTTKGLIEHAHRGTLLLDEIGTLSLDLQAKMLRFLEERRFYMVGGKKERQVDLRIIAATNQDLEGMVREKQFRRDLFYRLDVVSIEIPPLRKRKEDIPDLLKHFYVKFALSSGKAKAFDSKALEALYNYEWPGNVRELENAVQRGYSLSSGEIISFDCLPPRIQRSFESQSRIRKSAAPQFIEHRLHPNGTSSNNKSDPQDQSSLRKVMDLCDENIGTLLRPFRPLFNPQGTRLAAHNPEGQKQIKKLREACPDKIQIPLDVLEASLNPHHKERLEPDRYPGDMERLKLTIDLCKGNIKRTSNLLTVLGYQDNISLGFIKSRLGLDKSNMKYVIEALSAWYQRKFKN